MMPRIVAAETLDGLAVDDPAAMRSRRDLRRVHHAMGTRSIVHRALRDAAAARRKTGPLRVLELGAGDGSLMLGVARALAPAWPQVELTLLDAQALVDRATIKRYGELGWHVVAKVGDVLNWAASASDPLLPDRATARWDLIVSNLFVHHFEGAQFAALLNAIAARTDRFFACEPRRAWLALAGSHLIGAIGVSAVTREDAVLSVHAGFRGNELTALWPTQTVDWQLREYSAGLFSHCFRAERVGVNA
ncbi:class I SAM-dependent methyltransferase [Rhodoferax sp.]|uniref:class I SAM-dependent methyltransferase n=1 Tax=Rhodoferax sp. TaxID=50421 RepID=UPI00374CEB92